MPSFLDHRLAPCPACVGLHGSASGEQVEICNSEYGCCKAAVLKGQAECTIDLTQQGIYFRTDKPPVYLMQYAQSYYYSTLLLDQSQRQGSLVVKESSLAGSGWNADFSLRFNQTSATSFMFPESSTPSGYLTCHFGQPCKAPSGWVLTVAAPSSTTATWYYYSRGGESIEAHFRLGKGKDFGIGSFSVNGLSKSLNHTFGYKTV